MASQNSVQMRSLFVGNIPKDLESPEEFLATLFGKVGLVLSVKLCRDVNTQKSLGHAYVNFQNIADAERAQQQLNYTELPNYPGRELRVAFSERDPNVRARGKSLFVKNIDSTISNKDLHAIFAEFGVVIDCCQATDSQGRKLGFGSVQFAEPDSADKALESLNGKKIGEKVVTIAVKECEEDKTFTKIFVRGIKADATDDEIRVTLGAHAYPVGAVASLIVTSNPANGTRSAIIDLGDHDAAVKAVEALNDKKHSTLSPGDANLTAAAYRKPDERRKHMPSIFQNDGRNLYVKYLPDYATEGLVRDVFKPFGDVESVYLATDGDVFRGFGFVCYKSKEDAERAVKNLHMDTTRFGRPLYVAHAQHRDQRINALSEQTRAFANPQQGMGPPGFVNPMMMPMGPRGPFNNGPMGPMGPMFGRGGGFGQQPMMGRMPGPYGAPFGGPRAPFQQQQGQGPRGPMGHPRGGAFGGPRPQGNFNNNVRPQQPPQQQILTADFLAGKTAEEQKNILGERLYNNVLKIDSDRAAKITGMLLELNSDEILAAVNDFYQLSAKVAEAQSILDQHS